MFQEMEGCLLFCPGSTVQETHRGGDERLACRCYATVPAVSVCVCCGGVALGAREGRWGYRSYNTMHKARGQLMTCRWVLLETSSFPLLLE